MFKKILALVLALIMLTAVLASCNNKSVSLGDEISSKGTEAKTTKEDLDEEDDFDSEVDKEDGSEGESTREQISIDYTANTDIGFDDTTIYDELTLEQILNPENFEGSDIPDDRDYGGYEFKVLADTVNVGYEFIEQSDGDIVKDAVINRQKWIEEYVGIEFDLVEVIGGYYDMNFYASEIEAASGAGSPYDIGLAYSHIPPLVAAKGLSRDLAESENLNLYNTTKEYWGSGIKEEIMIGGRIFWMSDNSSWDSVRNLLCVFVNIEFFARANPGFDQTDLYKMVYGGSWTFDNMMLFIQNTYENTNVEDAGTDKGDTFGLQADGNGYSLENWLYGAGFSLTKINNKGTYEWTLDDQSFIDFSDWWQDILNNNENVYNKSGSFDMFKEGRSMFAMAPFKIIENQIELDFTVLPLPIYNPDIKNNYSTPILNDYGSWLIPKATKKEAFERSATVLELIAAEGNRRIAPVYFEIYLKRQNAGHDEDMQKMFNIIRNAIVFDVGFLYGSVMLLEPVNGDIPAELFLEFRRMWRGDANFGNISTYWARTEAAATSKLNNLMVDILDY